MAVKVIPMIELTTVFNIVSGVDSIFTVIFIVVVRGNYCSIVFGVDNMVTVILFT